MKKFAVAIAAFVAVLMPSTASAQMTSTEWGVIQNINLERAERGLTKTTYMNCLERHTEPYVKSVATWWEGGFVWMSGARLGMIKSQCGLSSLRQFGADRSSGSNGLTDPKAIVDAWLSESDGWRLKGQGHNVIAVSHAKSTNGHDVWFVLIGTKA